MAELTKTSRARRALESLIEIAGLTQHAIAERIGIAPPTVSRWVQGRCVPRSASLAKLEALLDKATRGPDPEVDRVRAVVARLHASYGSPNLNNKSAALDELFFILLSLKTSHRTYEDTYHRFHEQFNPWSKLLSATVEEVESHIRSGGVGTIRARAFIDIARRLHEDFGEVSLDQLEKKSDADVEEYLTSLPGVGIKTARCVSMYALKRDTTPVDTHTYRVGVRIGLIPTSRSASDAHLHFDRVVPPGLAYALHTNFVAHGREICVDPIPKCGSCTVRTLCDYYARLPKETSATEVRTSGSNDAAVRPRKPVAADIYAGCGGLSLGLRQAGFDIPYALDWDKHACETHRANARETEVLCDDIRSTSSASIARAVGGHVDLLAGGPNCQGLSQLGLRSPDDPRNFMLQEFARLVSELQPTMFLIENVPGLAHRHNFPVLRGIFEWFRELGYHCGADVLLAADYGVPQLRYRFVMVGTRNPELPITLPLPSHGPGREPYVCVWDAIGDLPARTSKDSLETVAYRCESSNAFQRYARRGIKGVTNHVASQISQINLERIRHVPPGGNWKDIPAELLPPRLIKCRMTDHSTTYARLTKEHPSFTITGLFGNVTSGAFTHPTEHRSISVREAARLQSFPDSYVFHGPRHSQARQIGNAVPPLLARALGVHIRRILLGSNPDGLEPRITHELLSDQRAWDALPVLTPRFMPLFGRGTKLPVGWGVAPQDRADKLDTSWKLKPEYRPLEARMAAVEPVGV